MEIKRICSNPKCKNKTQDNNETICTRCGSITMPFVKTKRTLDTAWDAPNDEN